MTTFDTVRALASREFDLDEGALQADSKLEDFGIDSLSVLEFMFVLENEFDVVLSDTREPMSTLRDIVSIIEGLCAAKEKPVAG